MKWIEYQSETHWRKKKNNFESYGMETEQRQVYWRKPLIVIDLTEQPNLSKIYFKYIYQNEYIITIIIKAFWRYWFLWLSFVPSVTIGYRSS